MVQQWFCVCKSMVISFLLLQKLYYHCSLDMHHCSAMFLDFYYDSTMFLDIYHGTKVVLCM